MSDPNENDMPMSISLNLRPSDIFDEMVEAIHSSQELPPGAVAGDPRPDKAAQAAILVLAKYGLLDGSYFAIVKYVRALKI